MTIKVAVLTGKRGGFGAMKPMLNILHNDPSFSFNLIVTDQHLDKKFGSTLAEIEKFFPETIKIPLNQKNPSSLSRNAALSRFSNHFGKIINDINPDITLLYGDRSEVLVAAQTITILGKTIGHIQGGDLSGSIDDSMRFAISKLSHLHFASNYESCNRLKMIGEDPKNIFNVGDNHIDEIISKNFMDGNQVKKYLKLSNNKKIFIILQHSETTESDSSFIQMEETLRAVNKFDGHKIVIYPCSDPGYDGIIKSINNNKKNDYLIYKNIEANIFWGLMNIADCLIGNSSAGIIESPCFKLPTVNIGRRQTGRLHSSNVIHTNHNEKNIYNAIKLAISETFKEQCKQVTNHYGDGKAGQKIVKILKRKFNKNKNYLQKKFHNYAGN